MVDDSSNLETEPMRERTREENLAVSHAHKIYRILKWLLALALILIIASFPAIIIDDTIVPTGAIYFAVLGTFFIVSLFVYLQPINRKNPIAVKVHDLKIELPFSGRKKIRN